MKRFLLFTLVIGLFAAQADAALWELDEPTALQFDNISVVSPDLVGPLGVYDSWSNLYASYGGTSGTNYGAYDNSVPPNPLMSGAVGFVAILTDSGTDPGHPDGTAIAKIYAGDNAGITDTTLYSGITSYFQNDNDDIWEVELFYVTSTNVEYVSGYSPLVGQGGATYLSTGAPLLGINLSTISDIGFRVKATFGTGDLPSSPDAFHISVVPVPAAVILGILGLGVAGIKLRKYA